MGLTLDSAAMDEKERVIARLEGPGKHHTGGFRGGKRELQGLPQLEAEFTHYGLRIRLEDQLGIDR